ncbi:hypothetical protein [Turneriella parva]|uniref:DUF1795 domain-containing protein n=1 Tax=Turneriella parva (strain ATCC BAA-1111 / DSM 21527 / NCTC 11395 / H) TaxID=869212 RepID=I4B890_TURPD|nr:hypothetical protein [Turneriella parva]AFM13497.1 hypothetical protein Turpa_2858 [Turneriella parva DSM 21527]
MLRIITLYCIALATAGQLAALPFNWEPKGEEPGFSIDIPAQWAQASRARDKVANVHFEKKDRAGRVAIEVRAYSSDSAELESLVLQLRTRLAVKYDRLYLLKRKELSFRKGIEKQVWSARVGKQLYIITTAFVVSDDKVLQLVCVAPKNRQKEYEYVFDNALLSFDFSDGSGGGGKAEEAAAPEAAAAAPAPAAPAAPAVPGVTVTPPTVTTPAAPAAPTGTKPPKIEF